MYSYEDRIRAIALYIQYDHASATTIRELGYPSRKALYRWYREYQQSGDLHGEYRNKLKYSATQKQVAVEVEHLGMVQQSIQQSCGHHAVTHHLHPALKALVKGDDDRHSVGVNRVRQAGSVWACWMK